MELTDPLVPAPWQAVLRFPPFGDARQELPGDQPLPAEIVLPVQVNGGPGWMHFALERADEAGNQAVYGFQWILTWG